MTEYQGNEPQEPTPVVETPGQEPESGNQQPGYVTQEALKEAMAGLEKSLKDAMAQNYRGVQSVTGKFQAQVKSQLDAWEKQAQQAGITLTKEQLAQMETQAMTQALAQNGQAGQQPGPAAPPMPPQPTADQVNDAADRMMQAFGVEIVEGDPEDTEILQKASNGTPEQYLNAVQQAIKAKIIRTANTPQANPLARNPGTTPGAPISNPIQNVSSDDLWALHVKQRGG